MSNPSVDFQRVFEALPGNVFVLAPHAPDYPILGVSDELLHSAQQPRAQLLGQSILTVCAGRPTTPADQDVAGLRASLDSATRRKQPELLAALPLAMLPTGAAWPPRPWAGHIKPVLDEAGEVHYLLLSLKEADGPRPAVPRQQNLPETAKLYGLLLQAPVAVCIVTGPDFVVELANDEAAQLLGFGPSPQGQPLLDVLAITPERDTKRLLEQMRQIRHPYHGKEYPVTRKLHGKEVQRYYNFISQPYYEDPDAETATGLFIVGYDVTELVQARQQAEESREELHRFKFMADHANDALVLMRRDGSFAYVNHKALASWDYTREELSRLRVQNVDPLYQPAAFAELFERVQHEAVPPFETLHQRKDGSIFPVEVSVGSLLLNEEPHLLAVARDITKKKRAMEALQESEERFRIMADAAPNMVWAVHPDSSIRYVNSAFLEFVGGTLEEYLDAGWWSYMHPSELDAAQQTLENAISRRTIYALEHRMRRHDGTFRWLKAQGAPSYYANGELYGYVGSALDITELKQANEQLARINADLDNFIYSASHDLKAPISNIEGLLEALLHTLAPETRESEQIQHLTGLMQDSVAQFNRTITALADVAKLQQDPGTAASYAGLATVIRHVLLDLEPLRRQADGTIEVAVEACPQVRFSEENLRSIVYNLLSNALKYRVPGRAARVSVQSHSTPDYDVLTVADNGLGVPTERQEQLFNLFQRFHNHTEGSGIGLYMVKRMVENAGGKVAVESQPGAGTTFRIYFRR